VKDLPNEDLQKTLYANGSHKQSLYPNEYAHIVQKVFYMYVRENVGRKRIASWLNNNGYKTNRNKEFQEKHIIDILQNEVYIGNIVYGKTRYNYVEDEAKAKKIQQVVYIDEKDWVRTENAHPAIIEREVFELAQKKFQEQKQLFHHPKQFNAAKHPLTGLLHCGKCGAPMICQKRTNKKKDGTKLEYRYYVCSTYHKKGRNVCSQANVNADFLEEDLLEFIESKLKQFIDFDMSKKVKEKDNRKEEVNQELLQLDAMLKKKMNASKSLLESREYYDIETFIELNKELQEEVVKIREQKTKLEETLSSMNNDDKKIEVVGLYEEFKNHKPTDIAHKRIVFHKLLDSVVFQDETVTEINFNTSLPL
jgi:hypothetical protein